MSMQDTNERVQGLHAVKGREGNRGWKNNPGDTEKREHTWRLIDTIRL
jgi:hypothetical protein